MTGYHIAATPEQVAKYLPDFLKVPDPEGSLARQLADAMGVDDTKTQVTRTSATSFEATREIGMSGKKAVSYYTLSGDAGGTKIDVDITVDGKRPSRLQRVAASAVTKAMSGEVRRFEVAFLKFIANREANAPGVS